ncbi:MAG: SRPBCC family protein [Bacteroidota bacterium]|nr:SRPBCC family protein [Bacteroidota bacterium]
MKTKTIRQKVSIKSTAHEVYELLMDSKKHAQFSRGAAKVSRKVGGKFSVYDNYATGKNLELVQDKKIVQTWHASDWEEGHYSTVTFLLQETNTGCIITFVQEGVPEDQFSSIKQGWIDFYWNPMKKMLSKTE